GNAGPDDIRRLKEAGFDHVLGKPFHLGELTAILASSQAATLPPPAKSAARTGASYAEMLTRIGGDEKLLKRMVHTFLGDTPKRVAGIAAALRRKDGEALASLAHALKGSVSIFGAESARKLAEQLQELGRDANLSPAAEIFLFEGRDCEPASKPERIRESNPRQAGVEWWQGTT